MVGLPGSGKSTWIKNNLSPDIEIISRDIIRNRMGFTKSVDEKAVIVLKGIPVSVVDPKADRIRLADVVADKMGYFLSIYVVDGCFCTFCIFHVDCLSYCINLNI